MLANFSASGQMRSQPVPIPLEVDESENKTELIPSRSRTGHLRRKLTDGKATEFYGATSFFQISPSGDQDAKNDLSPPAIHPISTGIGETFPVVLDQTVDSQLLAFAPHSDICRRLMATFFQSQYQYHMCLYREYFLRDFDAGSGPYYSDLLMYAICAMGALASVDVTLRGLSDIFLHRAQELLYGSALESPNLTTLQAMARLRKDGSFQGCHSDWPMKWVCTLIRTIGMDLMTRESREKY
jgi:hypothetical protein